MVNGRFIGVEDELGETCIFSLVALRALHLMGRAVGTDYYAVAKDEMLRDGYWKDLLVLHVGDEIDLGTDENGDTVYWAACGRGWDVYLDFTRTCSNSSESASYKKYRKIADKYTMAGITFDYKWMEGGFYSCKDLKGKILPGCVMLTANVKYSKNKDKFEEMAWIQVDFTDVHLKVGTLINCFHVDAVDLKASIDDLIIGRNICFESSVIDVERLKIANKIALNCSELKISKAECIKGMNIVDSRTEITELGVLKLEYATKSDIIVGKFDCLELVGGRRVRFIFNNPSGFGELKLRGSGYIDVRFRFPNGILVDRVKDSIDDWISRNINIYVPDKDYEVLVNERGITSERLHRLENY